jgi:hypothetical protein
MKTCLNRIAIALVALSSLGGCQRSEDPAVLAHRRQYLLTSEPPGAVSVAAARAAAAQQSQPMVLAGRVGATAGATWDPGKAAFVISDAAAPASTAADPASHSHAGGELHDNCPFCQAKRARQPDPVALVQVLDESGAVLPIDARRLFGLREQQPVVVRGTAQIDGLGNLVVAADGIYLAR